MTSPLVFDRAQVRRNRARAAAGAPVSFLFDWAMENLIERLGVVKRTFPSVLQIGARAEPRFTGILKDAARAETLVVMDSAPAVLRGHAFPALAADEEALPFAPASFDLIVSPLSLHTVNDLPGSLIQIRRCLKPDGLLLAALPGGRTLWELRDCLMRAELALKGGASPRVIPFADKQQIGALMQRGGFALPVVDSEIVTVAYKTLSALAADLRGMGETNTAAARPRSGTGRKFWPEAERLYTEGFAEADGRIPATFEIIFAIGWAPHASQQKPLRPGSAVKSLADALGTQEIGTGEKARPDSGNAVFPSPFRRISARLEKNINDTGRNSHAIAARSGGRVQ